VEPNLDSFGLLQAYPEQTYASLKKRGIKQHHKQGNSTSFITSYLLIAPRLAPKAT